MSSLSQEIYSVALPIGNAGDLGQRAQEILERADLIFCEDTRKLQALATQRGFSFRGRLKAIPGDEEWNLTWEKYLRPSGDNAPACVALVSDAGTPVVNDPGRSLARYCAEHQLSFKVIPGPSAITAAVQWSGGFGLPLIFAGFAPKTKTAATKDAAEFFSGIKTAGTFVFFDSRHQVLMSLESLEKLFGGDLQIVLTREISKTYEAIERGTVAEMRADLEKRLGANDGIGELTFVVEGQAHSASKNSAAEVNLEGLQTKLMEFRHAPPRKAAQIFAAIVGISPQDAYDLLNKKS